MAFGFDRCDCTPCGGCVFQGVVVPAVDLAFEYEESGSGSGSGTAAMVSSCSWESECWSFLAGPFAYSHKARLFTIPGPLEGGYVVTYRFNGTCFGTPDVGPRWTVVETLVADPFRVVFVSGSGAFLARLSFWDPGGGAPAAAAAFGAAPASPGDAGGLLPPCPHRGELVSECRREYRCHAGRGRAWSPHRAGLGDCLRCAAGGGNS